MQAQLQAPSAHLMSTSAARSNAQSFRSASASSPLQAHPLTDPSLSALSLTSKASPDSTCQHLGPCKNLNLCTIALGRILGEGTFGKIYAVESDLGDGRGNQPLALKICQTDKATVESRMHQEAVALLLCSACPFVVTLYAYQGPPAPHGRHYFLMERAACSLADFLDVRSSRLDSTAQPLMSHEEQLRVMASLLLALLFMWNAGIVHSDIKPSNILLFACALPSSSSPTGRAKYTHPHYKICDFGGAVINGEVIGCVIKTPMYLPPEATGSCPQTYPKPTWDMWACGITCMELQFGDATYKQDLDTLWANAQWGPNFHSQVTEDFLRRVLHPNMRSRLTPGQALGHAFFKELDLALYLGECKAALQHTAQIPRPIPGALALPTVPSNHDSVERTAASRPSTVAQAAVPAPYILVQALPSVSCDVAQTPPTPDAVAQAPSSHDDVALAPPTPGAVAQASPTLPTHGDLAPTASSTCSSEVQPALPSADSMMLTIPNTPCGQTPPHTPDSAVRTLPSTSSPTQPDPPVAEAARCLTWIDDEQPTLEGSVARQAVANVHTAPTPDAPLHCSPAMPASPELL